MVEFKVANTREAIGAFRLVVKNYQKKGYLPSGNLISFFLVLARLCAFMWKTTCFKIWKDGFVLVAVESSKVVGTVTLEFNPSRLSIDRLFPNELKEIRSCGCSFVYFGSFAIDEEYNCTRTSMRMLKEQWRLLKERGTEFGVCVVNPCHSALYERFGFRVIATSDAMPGLSQAPAVLLAVSASDVRL